MEAAGFNVSLQQFEADIFFEQTPAAFEQVAPNPTVYPRYDGETGVWYTADFSGDGDVTAEAVVVDFTEPTTRRAPQTPAARPATTPAWTSPARSSCCNAAPVTSGSRRRSRARPAPPAR